MTHSNRLARSSVLFAAVLAVTIALPLRAALACGGYRVSEETQVRWAVNAHMAAVTKGNLKTLRSQWPDTDKKTLRAWVKSFPDKATWKVISVDVLDGRAAVAKVEVVEGDTRRVHTFTLAKRDGVWSYILRDVSASSRIAKRD